MEKAKEAVGKIIGRGGHHDTEVHETVNPAVTSETVKPHRHEETTQAIDREVHQHHYHTTVQPLQHKEVLPEQHSHQQMPVQEREFVHGDTDKIKSGVEREAAKFADTSTTHHTTHSTSQAPVAAGEHVHHHVHETVQPVVHKETVQPEVVHTTVPIHEVHHAQAEHHGMSTLPTKTLAEFEKLGGKIVGGTHRHEEYEGHPRPYNPQMQNTRSEADIEPMAHDGIHKSHPVGGVAGATGATGTTSGATGVSDVTGHTGTSAPHVGATGTHVSDLGSSRSAGVGGVSGDVGQTGTALGGRAEGNTAGRALDAATGHATRDTSGTSGIASEHTTGRGLEHSTRGDTTTAGSHSLPDRTQADTSSSTKPAAASSAGVAGSDIQSPRQGQDPSLVEKDTKSGGWKGDGVDGSHSAVFGLTPDGHKHRDTSHSQAPLKPAHSEGVSNTSSGDVGSRAPTGSAVADQMHDPRVAEKGHGGSSVSNTGTTKPGAGAPGGEQGFGEVRPHEHGSGSKLQAKLDPTTDADNDGKRGVLD